MGQYSGESIFHDQIYQFEETDVVQGGPDGKDNLPLKQLADRTKFLFSKLGSIQNLSGDIVIGANSTITKDLSGALITVSANGIREIILDDVETFPPGAIIPIASFCLPESVVRIIPTGLQYFYDLDGSKFVIHMHHKEQLFLVACSDHWKILNASGNFYCAGEETKARKILKNTVVANGQLLRRALYPRLWEFVQTLTFGQEVTNDSSWLAGTAFEPLTYRGLYSTGDGVITFRVPDERSMTERMLDMGRGIDFDRFHNYAGGYQKDKFKSHSHTMEKVSRNGYPKQSGDRTSNYYYIHQNQDWGGASEIGISPSGGSETNAKNIGKLFLIKY